VLLTGSSILTGIGQSTDRAIAGPRVVAWASARSDGFSRRPFILRALNIDNRRNRTGSPAAPPAPKVLYCQPSGNFLAADQ
jgi:hypothetical protein